MLARPKMERLNAKKNLGEPVPKQTKKPTTLNAVSSRGRSKATARPSSNADQHRSSPSGNTTTPTALPELRIAGFIALDSADLGHSAVVDAERGASARATEFSLKARYQVGTKAEARGSLTTDLQPSNPELVLGRQEVVLLDLRNGQRVLMRADTFADHCLRPVGTSASQSVEQVETQPLLALAPSLMSGSERSLSFNLLTGLAVVDVPLAEKSAEFIAKKWDHIWDNPRAVYQLDLSDTQYHSNPTLSPIDQSKPFLVLVHGTFVNGYSSFGKLWGTAAGEQLRQRLLAHYGQQVWSLEHATLSESPVQNAITLARALPPNSSIDLMTHSRGGLVAECLLLGQAQCDGLSMDELIRWYFETDSNINFHPQIKQDKQRQGYATLANELRELVLLLKQKNIRVGSMVRAGCPSMGTSLASGRLDNMLQLVDEVLNRFQAWPAHIASEVAGMAAALVAQKANPVVLPGVEAMIPGSGLVRFLNDPRLSVQSHLMALSGDVRLALNWQLPAVLLSDRLFASDHDYVVNTPAMYAGIQRLGANKKYVFDRGETINHFSYFNNSRSALAAEVMLTRPAELHPYEDIVANLSQEPARGAQAVSTKIAVRPELLLIPGIMGSELKKADKVLWLSTLQLMRRGLDSIAIGEKNISAGQVLADYYAEFLSYCAEHANVESFPYDWRHSAKTHVVGLTQKIETQLQRAEAQKQPLWLVAHSMGGLLLLHAFAARPELMSRIKALPNSRILFCGVPAYGSFEAAAWFFGANPTQMLLNFVDSQEDVANTVKDFQSLADLMPHADNDSAQFFQASYWQDLQAQININLPGLSQERLNEALSNHVVLGNLGLGLDRSLMFNVVGQVPETLAGFAIAEVAVQDAGNRFLQKQLKCSYSARGDGTVLWSHSLGKHLPSIRLPGVLHSHYFSDTDLYPDFLHLLSTGQTQGSMSLIPGLDDMAHNSRS
ncbi:MAG: hypothetical protein RLZZ502_912, partial [Pseudomonadota bacterium]